LKRIYLPADPNLDGSIYIPDVYMHRDGSETRLGEL
jgi:hypothetical protein